MLKKNIIYYQNLCEVGRSMEVNIWDFSLDNYQNTKRYVRVCHVIFRVSFCCVQIASIWTLYNTSRSLQISHLHRQSSSFIVTI